MDREKVLLHELMAVAKDPIRNTEIAVCSFMILRPRFIGPTTSTPSSAATSVQTSAGAIIPNPTNQPISSSITPVFDFYIGILKRPSPFLQQTVARFEKYLGECRQLIAELGKLLAYTNGNSLGANSSPLESLPKVMSNLHDFFVHVVAKRRRGDGSDPFLEADRRETAKQEATARRVHPTLHLPSQPSRQGAGLFASSSMPGSSNVTRPTAGASTPSTGVGFSLFNTYKRRHELYFLPDVK